MARKTKANLNIGDVFQIPIDGSRVGYGQLVLKPEQHVLFICVFGATSPTGSSSDLDQIICSEILLAGSTFDALLNNGHWKILGNVARNIPSIALPVCKYGLPGNAFVETLDRSRRRRATLWEESLLTFRTYNAPINFEIALKAICGVGEWLKDFESMKYGTLKASSKVVV